MCIQVLKYSTLKHKYTHIYVHTCVHIYATTKGTILIYQRLEGFAHQRLYQDHAGHKKIQYVVSNNNDWKEHDTEGGLWFNRYLK